ncbi:MAG: hypothetical protein POH28_06535, partial [Acidocella sp.]|nr:hypothetical protein [Acidocella sp.]
NMPHGAAPNSLSKQAADDVLAFVLSPTRPSFDRNQVIAFASEKVSFNEAGLLFREVPLTF